MLGLGPVAARIGDGNPLYARFTPTSELGVELPDAEAARQRLYLESAAVGPAGEAVVEEEEEEDDEAAAVVGPESLVLLEYEIKSSEQ